MWNKVGIPEASEYVHDAIPDLQDGSIHTNELSARKSERSTTAKIERQHPRACREVTTLHFPFPPD
jgi:hypothetical protein